MPKGLGVHSVKNDRTEEAPVVARPRVLVVDDEPLMGTTLRVTIGDENEVVVASSGVEAREILQTDATFDVILCDLMMPGYSGMDLHDWLGRTAPSLADRMVFMTGGAYTDEARTFLNDTTNPHVDKPFDIDRLLELIRDMAHRPRPAR